MSEYVNIFIQARLSSTRLPGKVLKKFSNGYNILDIIIRNLRRSKTLTQSDIVILTSSNPVDEAIVRFAKGNNLKYFCGSEENVLERFQKASEEYPSNYIVRVCADNPFVQAEFLDSLIVASKSDIQYDYLSYRNTENIPAVLTHTGFFTEIFTSDALKQAGRVAQEPADFEHVTRVFYNHPDIFKLSFLDFPKGLNLERYRFTIDTIEDFNTINEILLKIDVRHREYTYQSILEIVDQDDRILDQMATRILKNQKVHLNKGLENRTE